MLKLLRLFGSFHCFVPFGASRPLDAILSILMSENHSSEGFQQMQILSPVSKAPGSFTGTPGEPEYTTGASTGLRPEALPGAAAMLYLMRYMEYEPWASLALSLLMPMTLPSIAA